MNLPSSRTGVGEAPERRLGLAPHTCGRPVKSLRSTRRSSVRFLVRACGRKRKKGVVLLTGEAGGRGRAAGGGRAGGMRAALPPVRCDLHAGGVQRLSGRAARPPQLSWTGESG